MLKQISDSSAVPLLGGQGLLKRDSKELYRIKCKKQLYYLSARWLNELVLNLITRTTTLNGARKRRIHSTVMSMVVCMVR